jgi:hypothetical protein
MNGRISPVGWNVINDVFEKGLTYETTPCSHLPVGSTAFCAEPFCYH